MARSLGEWEILETLATALGTTKPGVVVGIGDDCAVVRIAGDLVVTTDACLEDVHYRRKWLSPGAIATKALGAAVSDLAAMGAKPLGIVCHLTVPASFRKKELSAFARAQRVFAEEHSCSVLGGNVASGKGFDVVTTAFGSIERGKKPLLRSGASVGDEVWLVGDIGWARLGLALLERGKSKGRSILERRALRAFDAPRPRLIEGRKLAKVARAALDVSDGLVGDAEHLAKASKVRVVFDEESVRGLFRGDERSFVESLGLDPLEVILFGGEDYALLATGPRAKRPRFARAIGRIEAGEGVALEGASRMHMLRGGFQHGR